VDRHLLCNGLSHVCHISARISNLTVSISPDYGGTVRGHSAFMEIRHTLISLDRIECSISSITSRAGPSRIGECVTHSTLRRHWVDNFGRYDIAGDNFVNHLNPMSVKVVWFSLRQHTLINYYRFPHFP